VFGSSGATASRGAPSGEQTAFWRPDSDAAAPILRFDDGMVVTVDEDLVLGRRPDNHEMVTSGQARPVPIADTQNVLSSAHAALTRSGREVSLVDLGSLNGTHVAGPEATEWTQLEPGVAHPLSDGDRLLLGWTVITFEQPQD
jgi:pSer/pThr/pTyr-binding forkhead associated (FHA) protein